MGVLGNIISAVSKGVETAFSTGSITKGIKSGVEHYQVLKQKDVKLITTTSPEVRKTLLELAREGDEHARKALLAERQIMLEDFHSKVRVDATLYESTARKVYEETYTSLIEELSKVIDVKPIRIFIAEKSETFKNTVTFQIVSKICLGNHNLTAIMDDYSLSPEAYEKKMNNYANKVFNQARLDLLDKIKVAIEETNEYIKENATTFLNAELSIIESNNQKMKELAKKGADRDAELRRISQQQIILSLIQSTAKEI